MLPHGPQAALARAVSQANLLRIRATGAVPALRRVAADEADTEANRDSALHAITLIEEGTPAIRFDEPYYALSETLRLGTFTDAGIPDAVHDLLEREDYLQTFEVIEAGP